MSFNEQTIILAGVCGSNAHGLATASSDEDVHGIFVTPTMDVLGFTPPADSHVTTDPDTSYHEVKKLLSLALKSNPTAIELLWLPEHTVATWEGLSVVDARHSFLSAKYVKDAYIGYAVAQWTKLNARDNATFSASTSGRTLKHARHLFRLLETGINLYATGELTVKVADRDWYLNVLPEMTLEQIGALSHQRIQAFSDAKTVLPEQPDRDRAEAILLDIRKNNL